MRAHALVVVTFATLVAALGGACSSKKQPPAGSGSAPPPGPPAPRPVPPPAGDLTPLAADPGGATGAVEWVTSLGGPRLDVPTALAVAGDGATYATGYFEEQAEFGKAGSVTAAGKSDTFLVRIDAAGAVDWLVTAGGKNDERGAAVAVAADGSSVFGGLFSATLKVGELEAKAAGSDDLFVAGVDPRGSVEWLWTTGGEDSDDLTALAAAPGGGWIAAVSFGGTVELGSTTLTSRGAFDAALVKLAPGGEVEWVTQLGGEWPDLITHLAVDPAGNIFAMGRFRGTTNLGGADLESAGDVDLFLARYDAAGNHVWSKRLGNAREEVAGGLAVDRSGNLAITGSFDADVDFFGTPVLAKGESDLFVARLDGDGQLLWVKTWGAERVECGYGLDVDAAGNLIVAGWFETSLDLGGGPMNIKGYKDGFVAKLAPDGGHLWSKRFGDKDIDGGQAVAIAPDGSVRLAGFYRFTLDLAGDKGPVAVQAPGARLAKPDVFVAKLAR